MLDFRTLLIGLAISESIGACSGSLAGAKSDAGRDGTGRDRAASVDHPSPDGMLGASDGLLDASSGADGKDGGGGCPPLDLATQCPEGAGAECQPTWTDAVANPQCGASPASLAGLSSFAALELRIDCGAYHVRKVGYLEHSETYYYEIASGLLVAIARGNANGPGSCWGLSEAIATDCSNGTWTPVCTLYGGALSNSEAGLVGDGGGSNCLASDSSPPLSWNAPCAQAAGTDAGADRGTDAGTACYASCQLGAGTYRYVGCVSGSSVGNWCYASCSECP